MLPRHRVQQVSKPIYLGKYLDWPHYSSEITGHEIQNLSERTAHCKDSIHPGWNVKRPVGNDIGGPCQIISETSFREPSAKLTVWRPGFGPAYEGCLTAKLPGSSFWDDNLMWPNVDSYGPQAYNRMKPAQPEVGAAQFIAELRELPSMLRQRFLDPKNPLKSISNYHLAYQFGWKPLLNDMRRFYDTHLNSKKVLDQLIRDEGRPVRRTTSFPVDSKVNEEKYASYGALDQLFVSQCYGSPPLVTDRVEYQRRIWATARFKYWLPSGPRDWAWNARILGKLYGLNPTPSVIYNLTPWSWLVDWFNTAGDVIENLEAGVADRLAADYFYLMAESTVSKARTVNGEMQKSFIFGTHANFSTSSLRITQSKQRIRGNPFGFYMKDNGLSAMQLSILGALAGART